MAVGPRIRIESDGIGSHSRVLALEPGGGETELRCVTGADVRLRVGELNTATLEVIVIGGCIEAELERLMVRVNGVSRVKRLAWWARKLWWRAWYVDPGRRPMDRAWRRLTRRALRAFDQQTREQLARLRRR